MIPIIRSHQSHRTYWRKADTKEIFLLFDMSSLDLFPSTLVVFARSFERAFLCPEFKPVIFVTG